MKISIIVPTYRRPLTLLQALRSLQRQTLTEFEILAVDNAADPEINRLVSEFNETARIPVRYIAEGRTGVHYARNLLPKQPKEIFYSTQMTMCRSNLAGWQRMLKRLPTTRQWLRQVVRYGQSGNSPHHNGLLIISATRSALLSSASWSLLIPFKSVKEAISLAATWPFGRAY